MRVPGVRDWISLVLLSCMWGTSFLFTKIAVTALPPTTVVASRLLLAALILAGLVWWRGLRLPHGWRIWRHFFLLSLLGNTLPFLLISWGQQAIDSGLASMLLAAMPLATLVLAHFFVDGESMTRPKAVGFLLGLSGIAILIGPDAVRRVGGDSSQIASQAAVFGAALLYAVNAILARHLPDGDPVVHTAATVSIAALTMLPIGFAGGADTFSGVDRSTAVALLWLGTISTAAATILYFRIIASVGPTFLALINYLIPPVAIIAGAVVLGEKPSATSLLALTVILSGIAISQLSPAAWSSTHEPESGAS